MTAESLIELKPLGINVSDAPSRPLLLLKDDTGELTMPLAISAVDAGILLQQTGRGTSWSSPHVITEQILKLSSLKIKRCLFTEIRQGHVMAKLELSALDSEVPSSTELRFLEVKAEVAVILCLYLSVPLFATRDLIWKARHQGAEQKEQSELMVLQTSSFRPHSYLM